MKPVAKLRKAFPDANIQELGPKPNYHGCNLYFPGICVSVYYKKQRYGVGTKWGVYKTLDELISIIEGLINPPKKVAHIEPLVVLYEKEALQPINSLVSVPVIKNHINYGVQQCISHILKKRDFIMSKQPDNKLAAFCLTLADELKSYL